MAEEIASEEEAAPSASAVARLRSHPRVHWSEKDLGDCPRRRIVSLVPSLSEAIELLGLGDRLVGVTEYCVLPEGAFDGLPKLGGTKDADVEAIVAVSPDLVIANQEENTARVVRKLAEHGIDVWVTYPRTVREGAELLSELADLGATAAARAQFVTPSLEAVEQAERARAEFAPGDRPRVFCAIWRDPWMTIGRDTYIHDMIELCGGQNLFADPAKGEAAEAVSGRADRRYPIVELAGVVAAAPEVILLPDEPYRFAVDDAKELAATDCPAAKTGRIHLIDGTLVSWYGPRIAEAIQVLAAIFRFNERVG